MKNQINEEIKRVNDLINKIDNKNYLNEDILSDLGDFISKTTSKIKDSEIVKKISDFFSDAFSDISDERAILTPDVKTSDDDFYKKILDCVGAPHTKDNMLFFYAWRQSEGGTAANNPFNTTRKKEGASLYKKNTAGVKNYKSVDDGIKATCETLKLPYYTDIVSGLKNDVGLKKLSRMASIDKWGTGDLLSKVADGYLDGKEPKPKPINKGSMA